MYTHTLANMAAYYSVLSEYPDPVAHDPAAVAAVRSWSAHIRAGNEYPILFPLDIDPGDIWTLMATLVHIPGWGRGFESLYLRLNRFVDGWRGDYARLSRRWVTDRDLQRHMAEYTGSGSRSINDGLARYTSLQDMQRRGRESFAAYMFPTRALALPIGAVLLQGSRFEPTLAGTVTRFRCSSMTTSLDVAFQFMGRFGVLASDREQHRRQLDALRNIRANADTQPLLFVHTVTSRNVLAIDTNSLIDVDPEMDEKEVILQPYIRFHVVKDEVALVDRTGYGATLVRVLKTHVFVEDVCPLCAAGAVTRSRSHTFDRLSTRF